MSSTKRSLLWGLGSFLILRIAASLAAAYALAYLDVGETVAVPGYITPEPEGLAAWLLGPWVRADTLWYLKIADSGYDTSGAFAFSPLYPIAIRALTPFVGDLAAALLISNLACAVGFVLLYRFLDQAAGPQVAAAGTLGLAVYPASFFLVGGYAEPLLLALGSGSLLTAARSGWWAGALGALAALTRPFGVLLALPLLLITKGTRRWAAAGPVAGAVLWAWWAAWRTGDLLAAVRVQSYWQRESALPWETLWQAAKTWFTFREHELGPFLLADLAAGLLVISLSVTVALLLKRRGPSPSYAWGLGLFGAAVAFVAMSSPFPPRPLLSMPRFALAAFPVFAGYAALPKPLRWVGAGISLALLTVLTSAFVAARPIF